MKKNILNRLKRAMATVMMACMLLTVIGVSSNADAGIMPCGVEIDMDRTELN